MHSSLQRFFHSLAACCEDLGFGLSGPFQSNVKPEKLLSATQAADMLLDVIDSLEESDAGSFFDYARQPIPW